MATKERLVMCKVCREKFPKSTLIDYSKTIRMCPACYETEGQERKYYQQLKDLLCKIRGVDIPSSYDLKQIETLRKEGLPSKKIGLALEYMIGIKGIAIDKYLILNVRDYYQEAEDFLRRREEIQRKKVANENKPKKVYKPLEPTKKSFKHRGNLRNTRWIDLNELEVEEC